MLGVLLKGLIIGVVVAAPVGPVNLICIQRTIARGWLNGFVAGLGAVAGDALFAVLAAAGLVAAGDIAGEAGYLLQGVGAVVLLVMGARTIARATPEARNARKVRSGADATLWRAPVLTFGLTITNPATLLGFIAIFAGTGFIGAAGVSGAAAAVIVTGVAAGSALWWLVLTRTVGAVRKGLSFRVIRRINQVSGLLIIAFGLWLALRLARALL